MELLTRLKRRLGMADAAKDDLLGDLLLEAESFALAYTGRDFLPRVLDGPVVELAAGAFHRLGIEGEASHSEGGISAAMEGLPKHLKLLLDMYRLAKVGCP